MGWYCLGGGGGGCTSNSSQETSHIYDAPNWPEKEGTLNSLLYFLNCALNFPCGWTGLKTTLTRAFLLVALALWTVTPSLHGLGDRTCAQPSLLATIWASQFLMVTKLLGGGLCDTFFCLVVHSKEPKSVTALYLFTFLRTDLIQSEASWKLSSTFDWLMSAWKNVN